MNENKNQIIKPSAKSSVDCKVRQKIAKLINNMIKEQNDLSTDEPNEDIKFVYKYCKTKLQTLMEEIMDSNFSV